MKSIYLDYAAATAVAPEVLAAMQPYFTDTFYNPSATYLAARAVRNDIDQARARVAQTLGVRPAEIIFTAGGTEANNTAIYGVMSQFPDAEVLVSAIEHESVLEPAHQFKCLSLPVSESGIILLDSIDSLVSDTTVLVIVMYANNEIGTIQPIKQLAKQLEEIRKIRKQTGNTLPLYLHVDACQAANYLDLHVDRLGVDMMTLNGGKLYGPKQSGVLFVASHVELQPLVRGGGQERGLRSGTENVAACVGFATALELAASNRHDESKRQQSLQQQFIELAQQLLPNVTVNGSLKHRLPNNVHITIQGYDNERLMMQLDEEGIMCAVGSACSASSEEPSHVLKAIGLSDEQARSSLRFSLGRETTQKDIKFAVETLAKLVA